MKPEFKERERELVNRIKVLEEFYKNELSVLEEEMNELISSNTKAISNWSNYSEKYFECLGKINDWKYMMKKSFSLLFSKLKIDFLCMIDRILLPLR